MTQKFYVSQIIFQYLTGGIPLKYKQNSNPVNYEPVEIDFWKIQPQEPKVSLQLAILHLMNVFNIQFNTTIPQKSPMTTMMFCEIKQ